MAELSSQKSKTESVGSSVDGDGTDDEYDLYDYYNDPGPCGDALFIGLESLLYIVAGLSETEEERNEAVARKDIEHYDFTCTTYTSIWDQVKEQVDKIHQELKVWVFHKVDRLLHCCNRFHLLKHSTSLLPANGIQN